MIPLRLLFKLRLNKYARTGLWSFWGINIASLFFIIPFFVKQFNQSASTEQMVSMKTQTDTLLVDFESRDQNMPLFHLGEFQLMDDHLSVYHIQLIVEKGEGPNFELVQRYYSRGHDKTEAANLANAINYQPEVSDNKILIPNQFSIPQGQLYRGQHVDLVLRVPEGKSFRIGKAYDVHVDIRNKDHQYKHPWYPNDQIWTLGENGFINWAHHESKNKKTELSHRDFSRLVLEGKMNISIKQNDSFALEILGDGALLEKIDVVQTSETLNVSIEKNWERSPPEIQISMPHLTFLDAEKTGDIRIQGFDENKMDIHYESDHDLLAFLNVDSLSIKQIGHSNIDLKGKGQFLQLNLDNMARLDAEHFLVENANVMARKRSRIKLNVSQNLISDISESCKLELEGSPEIEEVVKN